MAPQTEPDLMRLESFSGRINSGLDPFRLYSSQPICQFMRSSDFAVLAYSLFRPAILNSAQWNLSRRFISMQFEFTSEPTESKERDKDRVTERLQEASSVIRKIECSTTAGSLDKQPTDLPESVVDKTPPPLKALVANPGQSDGTHLESVSIAQFPDQINPGSLTTVKALRDQSELEQAKTLLYPGFGALSTRVAVLAVRGDLHTDLGWISREIASIESPLGKQLIDRMQIMKSEGWRLWEMSPRELGFAGLYDPYARDLNYARRASLIPYLLGCTTEHPRESLVGVVAHELAHHDGLKHFPKRFLEGFSPEKLNGFRVLAYETNAIMAEIHVEQMRGGTVYSSAYAEALKKGDLGGQIHHNYCTDPHVERVTRVEAREFVNEYIAERWGNPLDANGQVKPFELNPPPKALAESKIHDPARLVADAGDYNEMRAETGAETNRNKLARALQSRIGSTATHGLKIAGALGAFSAVHSIKSSFNEGPGAGFGELAAVGSGFGGFEVGAACARLGGVAPLGKLVLCGFIGAYAAENIIGAPLKRAFRAVLD